MHDWEMEDNQYLVQEVHPVDTEPATEKMLTESSLLIQLGADAFNEVIQELIRGFPKHRFFNIVPKKFILGQTPIVIGAFPPLIPDDIKLVQSIFSKIKE